LRLFVSGNSALTERTLQRLHQLLEKSLGHPYTQHLKVVDVFKNPAEADQISATPPLIKVWPKRGGLWVHWMMWIKLYGF
jgi:circadian clock protein KaiB